ncbi:Eukaryotic/viral aspartic protease [Phytophthora megakarya]|uniref:Eukaryotic/viral aspartic protease n=1 Tax=Phytophthora megakarya TaxID=4795 RepID=A0A225W235_9STRA|nr:Eukaryotic/viral aspartic protease [Phytophthora megakarya]
MNVQQLLMELSLEVISVHNKVEHLQVDLIKVVIDLVLDKVGVVVDGVSRNLSIDHVPPVGVSIIRLTHIASDDANCASQYEAINELAKILRTKSAERVIDADCIYAFRSKCNYPDEDNNDCCMNTIGFKKERDISLGGGKLDLETEVKLTQDGDEYRWEKVSETGAMVSVHAKMVNLLLDERMGWWSSKRFDQRVGKRAIVRGAVTDVHIPILLDTGANVSIMSTRLIKRLLPQNIRGHRLQLEVQGIKKGKMSTSIRVAAKITLGWNTVYEFDFWVKEHSSGSEVVLGTDFMILAGIRFDLFHATANLPDKVMIPLVKA